MQRVWSENKKTLVLALPMMAGQLSFMLQGLADTLMIGRVGTVPLAAAAFVNVLGTIPIVMGAGLSSAVSVQVSHAHGAGENRAMGEAVRHGLIWSVAIAALQIVILCGLIPFLHWFGQEPEVIAAVPSFLLWITASMAPMMLTMALKSYCEGQNKVWPVFWILGSGVAINVVLNFWLIFGGFGVPPLGLVGAGISTFLARAIVLGVLWFYIHAEKSFVPSLPSRWLARIDRSEMLTLGRLAGSITGQILLEAGVFCTVTIMIGWLGAVALAAHQVALTCAATAFMLPLGLSMALTIRVGQAVGAGERERAGAMIVGAHAMSLLLMGCTALLFSMAGKSIALSFSTDTAVVVLAAKLLIIAGIFQIFDGGQVVSMGALRGLKDVQVPTWFVFGSYWGVGLPVGAALCFGLKMGAFGFWIGLASGLGVAAVALSARTWWKLRNEELLHSHFSRSHSA